MLHVNVRKQRHLFSHFLTTEKTLYVVTFFFFIFNPELSVFKVQLSSLNNMQLNCTNNK